MAQDTTKEFAARFERAVEGHPQAPATPYGRQAWVLEKLRKEAGLDVSPNTMSKWFKGEARPRPDNIRKIAQVLKVDEVWLSLGRKPVPAAQAPQGAENAQGAVLALAGMIEMMGGRVSFPGPDAAPVGLHINLAGKQFDAVVAAFSVQDGKATFLVNEPVGDARVYGVVPRTNRKSSFGFDIYNLTSVPRQTLGGFSVVVAEETGATGFTVVGSGAKLAPIPGEAFAEA